ncbi:MAG: hypothetical protein ACRC7H_01870 [Plesiomonas shigelloides]
MLQSQLTGCFAQKQNERKTLWIIIHSSKTGVGHTDFISEKNFGPTLTNTVYPNNLYLPLNPTAAVVLHFAQCSELS